MKKLLCITLSLCMIASVMPVFAAQTAFKDMTGYEYYADEIKAMTESGILKGYTDGTFLPENNIARSEMATIICKMLGKEPKAGDTGYTDVSADYWAAGYINVATELGIIKGDGDGLFRPEDNVNYEEAVKMITFALGMNDEAEANGGWPDGYIKTATEKNMLTKVSREKGEYVSRADVCTTAYKGMNADKRKLVDFGLPDYKNTIDGTTKERFEKRVSELTNEIPVVQPKTPKGEKQVFIAVDGNDSNDGTIEKPFATLAKAVETVKGAEKGAVIYIRGGDYKNLDTAEIAGLKGSTEYPIYISAYNNEKVTFVGGVSLDGTKFTAVSDNNIKSRLNDIAKKAVVGIDLKQYGINKIPEILSSGSYGTALRINEQTVNLARYPNTGLLGVDKIVDKGPVLNDGEKDDGRGVTIGLVKDRTPLRWKDTGDIWVRAQFYFEWNQIYCPIKINYDNASFTTKAASFYGVRNGENKYFFYNVLEELDFPNEYFIDRDNMMLYVYPSEDFTKDTKIYLSLLEGNKSIASFDNSQNVIVNGICFDTATNDGVTLNKCSDVVFQNCRFTNIEQRGLYIESECQRCGATCCTFAKNRNQNVRANGCYDKTSYTPTNNFVQNSTIYGNADQVLNSLVSFSGLGDVISHNLFVNGYATAVGIGGWESVVEYNEMVTAPKYQVDSGCVYGGGTFGVRATHVRYNYMHDVQGTNGMTRTVYFDDMSQDNLAYGNIAYKVPSGILTNNGRNSSFVNNISININNEKNPCVSDSTVYMNNSLMTQTGFFYRMGTDPAKYNSCDAWDARMPYFGRELADIRQMITDWNKTGTYTNSELENSVRTTSYHYFANNVSFNGGDVSLSDEAKPTSVVEDNYVTKENPGFVDVDNQNFNFKKDAPVFDKVKGFVAPEFDKMGILGDKKKIGGKAVAIAPRNGKSGEVYKKDIMFKWTEPELSTDFKFELSSDKDFKDMILSKDTDKEFLTASVPDSGKTYYWRITATTKAKDVENESIVSDTFTFTTMTEDEEKILVGANYDEINYEISKANDLLTSGKPFSPTELKNVKEYVTEAEKLVQNKCDAETAALTAKLLQQKVMGLKISEEYGYEDLNLDPDEWKLNGDATVEKNGDELVITPKSGNPHIISSKLTDYRRMFRFQMYVENLQQWWGITPTYDFEIKSRYFFVMKPDVIEYQKVYMGETSIDGCGIVKTVDNNGAFKSGTWQEVEVGNILCEDGVKVYLSVDGKEIINQIDSKNILDTDGGIQFLLNAANGVVKLRPSQIKDSQLPSLK